MSDESVMHRDTGPAAPGQAGAERAGHDRPGDPRAAAPAGDVPATDPCKTGPVAAADSADGAGEEESTVLESGDEEAAGDTLENNGGNEDGDGQGADADEDGAAAQDRDGQAADADAAAVAPAAAALDEATLRAVVEALIFASPEPVAEKAIAGRLPAGADAAALLAALAGDYATRGIRLVKLGDSWTFRTAPDLAPHLQLERKVTRKLSRAALEALGIVAYHQPVTRAEIEDIRGVALSRGTLDALMEAGWIRPGKRRRTPGRPVTWVTTPEFLDHFGLEKIEDLPGLDELKASGLLDTGPRVHVLQPGSAESDDRAETEAEDGGAEPGDEPEIEPAEEPEASPPPAGERE